MYANPILQYTDPKYRPLIREKDLNENFILKPLIGPAVKKERPERFFSFSKDYFYGFDVKYDGEKIKEIKVVRATKPPKMQDVKVINETYLTFSYKDGHCYVDSEKVYKGKKEDGKLIQNYSFNRCLEFKKMTSKGINNRPLYEKYSPSERRLLSKYVLPGAFKNDVKKIEVLASNTFKLQQVLSDKLFELCPNYPHAFFDKFSDNLIKQEDSFNDVEYSDESKISNVTTNGKNIISSPEVLVPDKGTRVLLK